jgi:hypothetical protein
VRPSRPWGSPGIPVRERDQRADQREQDRHAHDEGKCERSLGDHPFSHEDESGEHSIGGQQDPGLRIERVDPRELLADSTSNYIEGEGGTLRDSLRHARTVVRRSDTAVVEAVESKRTKLRTKSRWLTASQFASFATVFQMGAYSVWHEVEG